MKRHIILLLLTLFLFSNLDAQNLYLQNRETGKVKKIRDGKHVSIKIKSGKRILGCIYLVNDSTVKIRKQLLNLDEIISIRKRPVGQYVISSIIIASGIAFILEGNTLSRSHDGLDVRKLLIAYGVIISAGGATIGIIPHMRHYSKNWAYKIEMNK